MSAECYECGYDLVYPAGKWPIGECPVCSVKAVRNMLVAAVRDVVAQDLFPDPTCKEGPGCKGCLVDAMEGKRRLVAALEAFDDAEAVA